jgi:hypothetical protein
MADLTLNGTKGLELTREEVIDAALNVEAIMRKAQCREVNCDVIDELDKVCKALASIDDMITEILDSGE